MTGVLIRRAKCPVKTETCSEDGYLKMDADIGTVGPHIRMFPGP